MTQASLNFELSEYQERIAKTRVAMQAKGIELLIS